MNVSPLSLARSPIARSPWASAEAPSTAAPHSADAVTLADAADSLPACALTTAPETPSPSGTVGAIAWKAAAVALLAATTLLGAAGQAVAATPEAAPPPAQSTVLTPHQQRAARQGADLAQRTSTAVTNAVVDAANRIAAQNPDRPVTINIRDITVTIVGFDDFIDATQNNAPSDGGAAANGGSTANGGAAANGGSTANGGAAANGTRDKGAASNGASPSPAAAPKAADGGGEVIHRTFELRKGEVRIRATEDLRPAEPSCPTTPPPAPHTSR